jgi:adenosine deaminase
MPSQLEEYIAGLPKAELHVHHVGSASPHIVAELAQRHEGTTTVPTDPAELANFFTFTDFAHFVEVYLSVVDLIRTPEDIYTLTYGIASDLASQQVRYAELTLTPYSSIVRGIPGEAFCDAVEQARTDAEAAFGLQLRWCFDIPGEAGLQSAEITLDAALRLKPAGLISFGLGGPEIGVPRPQYEPFFSAARAAGLRSVPHAGETTGPQTIWDAIEHLGAERIGHGIAAAQDPKLMEYLREQQIPLEICPTSNVCTRAVEALPAHPLTQLVQAGVPISINSDDPHMFSTTLNDEYRVAAELLDLNLEGVRDLALAAVDQSFLPTADRSLLRDEISGYHAMFLKQYIVQGHRLDVVEH